MKKSSIKTAIKDVISRCDEITACAKNPQNHLSLCFSPAKTIRFCETCSKFLIAVADAEKAELKSAKASFVRMRNHVMSANAAIARRLGDNQHILNGVVQVEKTAFALLIKGDLTVQFLAGFAKGQLPLVRTVLTAAMTDVRKQLEAIELGEQVAIKSLSLDALQQITTAVRGVPDDRAETIAFMRMLYGTGGAEFHSYPKVVNFVRTCRDEKSPYFDRCAQIQALVRKWAKKEKDGIQKVWRSLTQELKPSHGKSRKSKFFS